MYFSAISLVLRSGKPRSPRGGPGVGCMPSGIAGVEVGLGGDAGHLTGPCSHRMLRVELQQAYNTAVAPAVGRCCFLVKSSQISTVSVGRFPGWRAFVILVWCSRNATRRRRERIASRRHGPSVSLFLCCLNFRGFPVLRHVQPRETMHSAVPRQVFGADDSPYGAREDLTARGLAAASCQRQVPRRKRCPAETMRTLLHAGCRFDHPGCAETVLQEARQGRAVHRAVHLRCC